LNDVSLLRSFNRVYDPEVFEVSGAGVMVSRVPSWRAFVVSCARVWVEAPCSRSLRLVGGEVWHILHFLWICAVRAACVRGDLYEGVSVTADLRDICGTQSPDLPPRRPERHEYRGW
jgi:hypothetical protein